MARKPRVRDHAAEYARLKARAQAAGMSTRGFRRARKAEPQKYYSPRAQVTLEKRHRRIGFRDLVAHEIAEATSQRAPINLPDSELKKSADLRLQYATDDQLTRFHNLYKEHAEKGRANDGVSDRLWLEGDDYDELGFLLYYRD